jgi:flagellar motor switch protein FliM
VASESLSQNEIDALLGGGVDKAAAKPAAAARAAVAVDTQVYDFRRPNRISKEKLRSLEAIYERFAKALESWLLGRVRGGMQLQLQSVEHFSFGEFTLSLPTPCASYTFEIQRSGQHGVIDFGHEFAYFLVDRLFGGSGQPAVPSRALTPIERMAVRVVAERVLTVLNEVWQDYVALDNQLVGFESIPEILRIASREDPVLVANIEVSAGETRSLLLICLPFTALEKFFAGTAEGPKVSAEVASERDGTREIAEQTLRGTRTLVSARLPQFQVSMRELLSLAPGRVLPTSVPRTSPLDVHVGSQLRFHASPGRLGAALAVKLTDGLLEAPETDAIPLTRFTP